MNVGPQDISEEMLSVARDVEFLGCSNPDAAMFYCRLLTGTSCAAEVRQYVKRYPGLRWRAYLSYFLAYSEEELCSLFDD